MALEAELPIMVAEETHKETYGQIEPGFPQYKAKKLQSSDYELEMLYADQLQGLETVWMA